MGQLPQLLGNTRCPVPSSPWSSERQNPPWMPWLKDWGTENERLKKLHHGLGQMDLNWLGAILTQRKFCPSYKFVYATNGYHPSNVLEVISWAKSPAVTTCHQMILQCGSGSSAVLLSAESPDDIAIRKWILSGTFLCGVTDTWSRTHTPVTQDYCRGPLSLQYTSVQMRLL